MTKLSLVVLAGLAGVAHADPAFWAKYEVKGVRLGMSYAQLQKAVKLPACVLDRATKPDTGLGLSFVVFLDKRCTNGERKCETKHDGNWCQSTVDGHALQAHAVASVGGQNPINGTERMLITITTGTEAPRVSAVAYYFPQQFLREDSPLGKTLAAKYGAHCTDSSDCYVKPEDDQHTEEGGGFMVFHDADGSRSNHALEVDCRGNGHFCVMKIEDSKVYVEDQDIQRKKDLEKAQAHQAPPPKL